MAGTATEHKHVKRIVDHMTTLGKRIHVASMPEIIAARNLVSGISEANQILSDSSTLSHFYGGIKPDHVDAIKTYQLPFPVALNIGRIFHSIKDPEHPDSILHEDIQSNPETLTMLSKKIDEYVKSGILTQLGISLEDEEK